MESSRSERAKTATRMAAATTPTIFCQRFTWRKARTRRTVCQLDCAAMRTIGLLPLLLALQAAAQERRDPRVQAVVQRIDPARLQAVVAKLVSFRTRHTLSDTTSETRGIGPAPRWPAGELSPAAPRSRRKPVEDRLTA